MQWPEDRCQPFRQQIDSARAFKHSNGNQDRDQKRNDAQDNVKTFLRALDELLINFDPARCGIDREEAKQERNRQQRKRVHASDKSIRVVGDRIAEDRWPNHSYENECEKNEESDGGDASQ